MSALLAPRRPAPVFLVLLALAAVAVGVAGFEHARLFHRGYSEVAVVGPLFLLNAIGSLVCILLLVFDRPVLFVLGALSISVGSIISILISHNSSFFKFSEGGYDGSAKAILISEIVATVLALAGAAGLRPGASRGGDGMKPLQLGLAAVVVVVMGIAIFGIAQGSAPKGDPAPTGSALAASKRRIANGNAMVKQGQEEFSEEGCNRCHAIAATGAKGKLGPRMDTQDDPAKVIHKNTVEPRSDIADGYEAHLMPTDYGTRMKPKEINAVVAFIKAASGKGGEDKG